MSAPGYRWNSLKELYFSRLREFSRVPSRIFWVYAFPTIMAVILAFAFRTQPVETLVIDVAKNGNEGPILQAFDDYAKSKKERGQPEFKPHVASEAEALHRLTTGKTSLVIVGQEQKQAVYHFDPTRPESKNARSAADDALQRAMGRKDVLASQNRYVEEPGTRYVDFLIPGLIGLNAMNGGLWGVGFLIVNFRRNGMLKRFLATPMPRSHFLMSILGARLTFLIPDVAVLLCVGHFVLNMPVRGSLMTIMVLMVVGSLASAGIGLLLASRTSTTEAVNGMINLVMMPQWLFSGVFFAYERFPEALHPLMQALPLTALLDGLRLVILEGAGLGQVWSQMAILAAWAVGTFALALRWFRWV